MAIWKPGQTPSDGDLDCLNSWPEGTLGYHQEKELIALLNALCKQYGYGRIPQLAKDIENIWRHPESIPKFVKAQAKRRKMMEEGE